LIFQKEVIKFFSLSWVVVVKRHISIEAGAGDSAAEGIRINAGVTGGAVGAAVTRGLEMMRGSI
jgi:hypothetical protein